MQGIINRCAARQYHTHAALTADLGFSEQAQLCVGLAQHVVKIPEAYLF